MPEVLGGSQPGITYEAALSALSEEFGRKPESSRWANTVLRSYNRALLDIHNANPHVRRFRVYDAPYTLISGTSVYDVREDPENGGFGWTNCNEILHIRPGGDMANTMMEVITHEDWRYRESSFPSNGPLQGVVFEDNYRVRFVPTPDQAYTGFGDYVQDVPYISTGRVDWPKGWDQVALLGAEYYISRFYRPEISGALERDYAKAMEVLRRTNSAPTLGTRPLRSVSTRRLDRRFLRPSDNSQDISWRY